MSRSLRRLPLCVAAAAAIASTLGAGPRSATQEPAPFEITQELLQRLLERALPAAREELGVALDDVSIAVATTEEVEEVLIEENERILASQYPAPGEAAAQARKFSRASAKGLLAKYAFREGVILVHAENFRRIAEMVAMPELFSEEGLGGVLAHEIVHAADDERFDLARFLSGTTTADALQARVFVLEGHAQLAGRRLAAKLGTTRGFETYTRAITAPVKESEGQLGQGVEHLKQLHTSLFSQAYIEGEAFVAALLSAGGDEVLVRAFRSPPEDTLCLAHPEWFLHPELRPALVFDLTATLDALGGEFSGEEWRTRRESIAPPVFEKAMAPLTAEEVAPLVAALRQNLVLAAFAAGRPNEQVLLGLYEFANPAAAELYLRQYQVMQLRRDEQMKDGALRIVAADYQTLEPPDPPGMLLEKRLVIGLTQTEARGLCILRGALVVEMVVVGRADWDADRMLALAARALKETAERPARAETPAGR